MQGSWSPGQIKHHIPYSLQLQKELQDEGEQGISALYTYFHYEHLNTDFYTHITYIIKMYTAWVYVTV